jgi:hypothetical protein
VTKLAALLMLMIAVHEGIFFGLPVEALEVVCKVGLALFARYPPHVICGAGGDQAIGHRLTMRVHVLLGQSHAALTVHGGEIGVT